MRTHGFNFTGSLRCFRAAALLSALRCSALLLLAAALAALALVTAALPALAPLSARREVGSWCLDLLADRNTRAFRQVGDPVVTTRSSTVMPDAITAMVSFCCVTVTVFAFTTLSLMT
jgi:hypothetical protein